MKDKKTKFGKSKSRISASSSRKHSKNARKNNSNKKNKKNRKSKSRQNGGYKNCSLGYAMVQGMSVPAINNVEGEINFPDVYAPLKNNVSCVSNSVNHPVLQQPNYS